MTILPALTPDPTREVLDLMSDFMVFSSQTAAIVTGLPEDLLEGLLHDFIECKLLSVSMNEHGVVVYERL